jgi:hypothetical protein
MNLMIRNDPPTKSVVKARLPTLSGASTFPRWRRDLQSYLFMTIKNSNIDTLSIKDYLDPVFFKNQFKEDFKAAGKDSNNNPQHAFDDEVFLHQCSHYSVSTGQGFSDWLYVVMFEIRTSLSDLISEQTAGVPMHDLVGLLAAIKLAIYQHEIIDPYDLELAYSQATMEREGKNDLMTFTSKLAEFMRRLEAAGAKVEDKKAQRVLVRGLNQKVFANFISTVERHPYDNYQLLLNALTKAASTPATLCELAALKPGMAQSALTTQVVTQETLASARMTRIEDVLVSLHSNFRQGGRQDLGRQENATCWQWAKFGQCTTEARTGRPCRLSHAGTRGSATPLRCAHHPHAMSHTTADCKHPLGTPQPSQQPGQHVNATVASTPSFDGYSFSFTTQTFASHVMALRDSPKIDMWVVDGASTTFATYDRGRCFNVQHPPVQRANPGAKLD